ncbi:uncharacterized protein OCT59_023609 [Rhizophagus irregularis]|uniref:Skt5p n=1 Tax=Rhizophagus irregularis (strain DAOM 197198w) TaxID=1432141 RepID=A0A015LHJ3_RHIIW|nr:Skt5p [Rhizophagus irregularis DAOM 197198w]UZO03200.1 hypothetical protein OCT59_023609 [Rhizophagus irregularis]
MCDKQLNSDNISSLNTNNLLNDIVQNFDKINIKEVEPTNIFEGDLNIITDELINFIFNELNDDEELLKFHVLNYIYNQKINMQKIYNWLLNNQHNSNSICLLGYFNYHGIEVGVNKQRALELFQKAAELENNVAQLHLVNIYIYGKSAFKNYNEAFKLSNKLAEKGIPNAINNLGWCYEHGIGVDANGEKAFELYQKAADLGSSDGISNLGLCYDKGIGTNVNKLKAFELYQKAADLGSLDGINNLGWCYEMGSGTNVNSQKAFELYCIAANMGYKYSQYNLAKMYETKGDLDQAIYWYNKSSEQGYFYADNKLMELTKK